MFYNKTQYVAACVDSVAHRHKLVYVWETLDMYKHTIHTLRNSDTHTHTPKDTHITDAHRNTHAHTPWETNPQA